MPTVTLTAKRQATFPAETCRELGLKPGDSVSLEAAIVDGSRVWVLHPRPARARAWAGSLSRYGAKKVDHSMRAIRASIANGRAREESK
jgi:bifunctional DNA-binding transcriptional regulator/antitoxin component of YhaV-PrlF toxin-antitoxin module